MSANEPGQPSVEGRRLASVDLEVPRVALAIGAHPDDIEFGCGGTLAKWAAAGCLVHHAVLTDGSKGTWNPRADIVALVATRQTEQREAARRLGARGETVFLGRVDGELRSDEPLRRELTRLIRRLRPDVVLGHDPWKRYRLHPDHREAGLALCDSVVAARDPHFFRDDIESSGIEHHRPRTMLLWEADEPDHGEDISATVETKIRALLAHESQFESTMKAVSPEEVERFATRMRERLTRLGERIDRPAAEIFKKISDL